MDKYLKYLSGTLVGLMLSTNASATAEYAAVLKILSNPSQVDIKKSIGDGVKTLGVSIGILASPLEGDSQSQLQLFEDPSNRNYRGIAFAPLSSVNLVMPIARAWKKGICLVDLDEKIDMNNPKKAGGNVEGFVTTDSAAVGAKNISFVIDRLDAEGSEVAIIEGKVDNTSDEVRRNSTTETLKKASQIRLAASQPADWDRVKALDVATNVLQRNPNIKVIYCANDTTAMGVAQTIANARKTGKMLVVDIDGIPGTRKTVEARQMIVIVVQNPVGIGATGPKLMANAEKSDKVIPLDKTPEFKLADLTLATQ